VGHGDRWGVLLLEICCTVTTSRHDGFYPARSPIRAADLGTLGFSIPVAEKLLKEGHFEHVQVERQMIAC
jgi:hypothetical protein